MSNLDAVFDIAYKASRNKFNHYREVMNSDSGPLFVPEPTDKERIASLERELKRLRKRNKELEDKISDLNWTLYPDRMGQ